MPPREEETPLQGPPCGCRQETAGAGTCRGTGESTTAARASRPASGAAGIPGHLHVLDLVKECSH